VRYSCIVLGGKDALSEKNGNASFYRCLHESEILYCRQGISRQSLVAYRANWSWDIIMCKATVQTGLGRVAVLLVKDQANMLTSHTPTFTPDVWRSDLPFVVTQKPKFAVWGFHGGAAHQDPEMHCIRQERVQQEQLLWQQWPCGSDCQIIGKTMMSLRRD
jgi:hypothetical protein